jgi:hypothetical protein
MGQIINARSLRVVEQNWHNQVNVRLLNYGFEMVKNDRLDKYLKTVVREVMYGEDDLREWGAWYSHYVLGKQKKSKKIELKIFIYESDIDNFMMDRWDKRWIPDQNQRTRKGRVELRGSRKSHQWGCKKIRSGEERVKRIKKIGQKQRRKREITREEKQEIKKLRRLMYNIYKYMVVKIRMGLREIRKDLKDYKIKIVRLRKNEVNANILGELIARRLYDTESMGDILRDIDRLYSTSGWKSVMRREEQMVPVEKWSGREKKILVRRPRRICTELDKLKWKRKCIIKWNKKIKENERMEKYIFNKLKKKRKQLKEEVIRHEKWRKNVTEEEKNKQLQEENDRKNFKIERVKGIRIEGHGMFSRKHKRMSQKQLLDRGRVPLSTVTSNIEHSSLGVNLKTSRCGVKIWILRGVILRGEKDETEECEI